MRLLLGSIFKVSIRHIYPRGNTYYYQRKIPRDLLPRYGGSTHIKVNLKTADLRQVARQVSILNKQHESAWSALRQNPAITPHGIRQSAIRLLSQHGLKPQPAPNDDPSIDAFIETLKTKEQAYVQDDGEDEKGHASLEEFLSPTEIEALRLINEKSQFRLSDALEVYLSGHPKKNDEKFVTYVQRVWNKLIGLIDDKEFILGIPAHRDQRFRANVTDHSGLS